MNKNNGSLNIGITVALIGAAGVIVAAFVGLLGDNNHGYTAHINGGNNSNNSIVISNGSNRSTVNSTSSSNISIINNSVVSDRSNVTATSLPIMDNKKHSTNTSKQKDDYDVKRREFEQRQRDIKRQAELHELEIELKQAEAEHLLEKQIEEYTQNLESQIIKTVLGEIK